MSLDQTNESYFPNSTKGKLIVILFLMITVGFLITTIIGVAINPIATTSWLEFFAQATLWLAVLFGLLFKKNWAYQILLFLFVFALTLFFIRSAELLLTSIENGESRHWIRFGVILILGLPLTLFYNGAVRTHFSVTRKGLKYTGLFAVFCASFLFVAIYLGWLF